MNKSRIFGISSRFQMVMYITVLSVVFIIAIFIRSFFLMENYDKTVKLADNLAIEKHVMQNFELQFITKHSENSGFFKSGRHRYINSFEAASLRFEDILDKLAVDFEGTEIQRSIVTLKTLNNEYYKLFKNFHNSLYVRGSELTGIISEVRKDKDNVLFYATNEEFKSKCKELNKLCDDYLTSGEAIHYSDFMLLFDKLANSINNRVITTSDETDIPYANNEGDNDNFVQALNKYKTNFKKLYEIDRKLGLNSDNGLKQSLSNTIVKFMPEINAIRSKTNEVQKVYYDDTLEFMIIFGVILLLFLMLFGLFMTRRTSKTLNKLILYFKPLSKGILPSKLLVVQRNSELQAMNESVNSLIEGLKKTTRFAQQIGQGTLTTEFEPLSDKDTLGNTLIEMRKNLLKAQEDEKIRQKEEQNRKWANEGLTEFNEILRQNAGNIDNLTLSIVRNITKFLNANQAGLFLVNTYENGDKFLELVATYAYDHERKKERKIDFGEGLVGMCAVEKSTVYLEDIPDGYLNINSGLGGANPRSLLIVPLKIDAQIFGVLEMASFNKMQKHEIEFVEKVTESISSTLSLAKINARTSSLLERSQLQAEEMAAQEEEMRKKFDEISTSQEEYMRKEAEMSGIIQAINTSSYVIEFDTSGYILNANEAFLNLLNIDVSQLVGKHQSDFDNMDKANIRPESFWQRLRDGEMIVETHKIFSGENARWLHETYTPILDKNGKPYKILNLATDITDNKKLEEELIAKTEKISAQKEKLEQNIAELASIQKELKEQQKELEDANSQIKENESKLREVLTETRENENKLKKRNAELAAQEMEYIKNLQNTELELNRVNALNEKFRKSNNSMKNNEISLKNLIEDLKVVNSKLEQDLSEKNYEKNKLIKQVDTLTKEIESLRNMRN